MAVNRDFGFYSYLPIEMRMMVVDEMKPDDRCRFSGCSKLSNKEAKKSKNYIYGLELHLTKGFSRLTITHGIKVGFSLYFEEKQTSKCVFIECKTLRGEGLWTTQLDDSVDVFEFSYKHFQNLLQSYQNIVKSLRISVFDLEDQQSIHFEVKNLIRLETLWLYGGVDVRPFIAKIGKSMKNLWVRGFLESARFLETSDKIYQISGEINSSHSRLDYQQVLQLSAARVYVNAEKLTEFEIFNFIQCWQNGTKYVEHYKFNMNRSKFDVQKFFEMFGVEYSESLMKLHTIKHKKEVGKWLKICYFNVGPIDRVLSLTKSNYYYSEDDLNEF